VPVAGHATLADGRLRLDGLVAAPDGARLVRGALDGAADQAASIGRRLAEQLLDAGARDILAALGIDTGAAA